MAQRSKKITPRPLIFDTDIFIWYFRGNHHALRLFENSEQNLRWMSSLSLMELLQGCRSQAELRDAQAFVAENISRILHPKTSVSEKAIHLIDQFSLSHGLRAIDALIAATALLNRAVLVSGNEKHFHFIPGLEFKLFKSL